jgi:transcriptional repressor NrdR
MKCPYCNFEKTQVYYPKYLEDGSIKRFRKCLSCGKKFQSIEKVLKELTVIKRDGTKEEFRIEKLQRSIEQACAKSSISRELIRHLAREIRYICEKQNADEIPSEQIAEEVLKRLLIIDKVSYIRYLSVYKRFQNVLEFIKAVQEVQ